MSAIFDDFTDFDIGPDGVRRYHTTCRVIVHSHTNNEEIHVSDDVVTITTSKTTKDMGSAAVTLVAAQNYMNILFPMDYINIYFDIGDGRGFTRTFFGIIDRVEENYSVDDSGKPSTVYQISCSDFQKVFEKTFMYFNPHMQGREDFLSEFGTPNLGGLALMTKGVQVAGSPPDIVQNLVLLMLGFGTQFVLPKSYRASPPFDSRQQILDYIESGLSAESKKKILDQGGFEAFLDAERVKAAETVLGAPENQLSENPDIGMGDLEQKVADQFGKQLTEVLRQDPSNAAGFGPGIVNAVPGANDRATAIIDILDMFTFIETGAMDGWLRGAPVWGSIKDAPLISALRSFSNEHINELMFDLRPMGESKFSETYSTGPDEIAGNDSVRDEHPGVTYVPAIVMREYPFSTFKTFDGEGITLNLTGTGIPSDIAKKAETRQLASLGEIPIGAIFSDRPNKAGRHVIPVAAINPRDKIFGSGMDATNRILDVAVVNEQEIKATAFGRSDHDHYNLLEVLSQTALLGDSVRFFMQDLQPLLSPIHVKRAGLRVRSLNTRFAAFDLNAARTNADLPTKQVDEPAESETEDSAPSDPSFVAPIQGASGGTKSTLSVYGYRRDVVDGDPIQRFHNGVDIFADIGTPVYAIADGVVCASVPKECAGFDYYSQSVILKHPGAGPGGEDIFSFYAHLDTREVENQPNSKRKANCCSVSVMKNGKLPETEIKAGDQIGTVGNKSGGIGHPNRVFKTSDPHLHFEIIVKQNNIVVPSNLGKVSQSQIDSFSASGFNVQDPTGRKHGSDGSTPRFFDPGRTLTAGVAPLDGTNPRSLDPAAFMASQGVNILAEANNATAPADSVNEGVDSGEGEKSTEDPDTAVVGDPENEEDGAAGTGTNTPTGGLPRLVQNIDSTPIRRQLGRWLILQDHWYQHNMEYLSGKVDMRGAPEIRAGYRLDLPERNMSFYVEGVGHTWTFPNSMLTSLQVTRGQPNNPHPLYAVPTPQKTQKQDGTSRLAKFFITPDPIAVRRSVVLRDGKYVESPRGQEDIEDPTLYGKEQLVEAEVENNFFGVDEEIDALEQTIIDALGAVDDLFNGDSSSLGGNDTTAALPRRNDD